MSDAEEQAVLVYLRGTGLPDEVYKECDVGTLEVQLIKAIESANAGEFDGNEFGPDEVTLYMYGLDAEALFQAIQPVLNTYPLCQGARVLVRPGGPNVEGRIVNISPQS